MKRCLEFMILGFIGLLLAGAVVFSPTPIAKHATLSVRPSGPQPAAADKETSEGPVLNVCPLDANHSRVDRSSPHGIAAQFVIPVILESHGLGNADLFASLAHEIAFDQFRRAPPLNS